MREILVETGADPALLELELTESVLAEDLDAVVARMAELRRHGVRFSLDDFGTGFSSLSDLRRLPLDQLKIDQSFVRNLVLSPQDRSIARTVLELGRSLGLNVIAEGVETSAHRELLAGLGCRSYQGYLFNRPLAGAQFDAFAERQAANAADAPSAPIAASAPASPPDPRPLASA